MEVTDVESLALTLIVLMTYWFISVGQSLWCQGTHKRKEKLTILIATNNCEESLEGFINYLNSWCQKQISPVEVLFIDNRSCDKTGEILTRMAVKYNWLNVLHLKVPQQSWKQMGFDLAGGEKVVVAELTDSTKIDKAINDLNSHM